MNKVVVISIIGLVVLGLILTFVLFSKSKKLPPPSPPPKPSTPPEVFAVGPFPDYRYTKNEAEGVCKSYGAEVATNEQLEAAQRAGAEWCYTGWLKDDNGNITEAKYPMQKAKEGCGDGPGIKPYTPKDNKAGVNCYGVKPPSTQKEILSFNEKQWNQYEQPEKCLKDEDCVELLKEGVKRAYKSCNEGVLSDKCKVECKDCFSLTGDNSCVQTGCLKDEVCEEELKKEGVKKAYKRCNYCVLTDFCIKECKDGYSLKDGECTRCEKDEVCNDLVNNEGVDAAYKKCNNNTGVLDSFCTVKCKDGYQLELDNTTCKKKPYVGCGPGCNNCIGLSKCGGCLPGLKLVEGECEFDPLDPHWTLNVTGTACHCVGDGCKNGYACKSGTTPYSYGDYYYGCQIPSANITGYDRRIKGLPDIIQGIPAVTHENSDYALIPSNKVPEFPWKLPLDLATAINMPCRSKYICDTLLCAIGNGRYFYP